MLVNGPPKGHTVDPSTLLNYEGEGACLMRTFDAKEGERGGRPLAPILYGFEVDSSNSSLGKVIPQATLSSVPRRHQDSTMIKPDEIALLASLATQP